MANQKSAIRILATGFLAVGICICIWGIDTIIKAKKSKNWPNTKGVIISSSVTSKAKNTPPLDFTPKKANAYEAKLLYEYTVKGKTYQSRRLCFGDFGMRTSSRAKKIVSKYPEGKEILIYYDPDNHKSAVLEPGITRESFGFLGLGIVCVLCSLHMICSSPRKKITGKRSKQKKE